MKRFLFTVFACTCVIFCFCGCDQSIDVIINKFFTSRTDLEEQVKDMLRKNGISSRKVLIVHKSGYQYEGTATCAAGQYTVELDLDITFDGHVIQYKVLSKKELIACKFRQKATQEELRKKHKSWFNKKLSEENFFDLRVKDIVFSDVSVYEIDVYVVFQIGETEKTFTLMRLNFNDKNYISESGLKTNAEKIMKEVERIYKSSGKYLEQLYQQGCDYYYGRNGKKMDHAMAFSYFEMAASQGHVLSQWWTGHGYYSGLGIKKDLKQARYWFDKAAANGDPDAKNMLKNF